MTCEACGRDFAPGLGFVWRRFCGRSCAGKALAASVTHAQRVARGREGGAARQAIHRRALVERFAGLSREQAIEAAWLAGRHAGRQARVKQDRGAA